MVFVVYQESHMKSISSPLGDANIQISTIAEELAKKTEDASRQQEEITYLLSQIVDLQKKAKSVSSPHCTVDVINTRITGFKLVI